LALEDRGVAGKAKGGWLQGRAAFWAVAAALSTVMMGATLQTPLYVRYQHRFGFSEIVLTLIYAVYIAGTLAALVFLGRFSDQAGRRRMMLVGTGVAATAILIFLFTVDTAMLFIARALFGFTIGIATATATAWLTELHPDGDQTRASLVASAGNLVGLGLGPILAGLLSQYAPLPLRLIYIVYLVLLAAVIVVFWSAPETVEPRAGLSLWPRLGVPRELFAQFVGPATAAFSVFSLSGLFAALTPTLLERLDQTNSAVAGAAVLGYYSIGALTEVLLRRLASHAAMLAGLGALLGALTLVVLAPPEHSLAILLGGMAIGGFSQGMGFRGSLQVVNQIAPPQQRAAMLAMYFVVGYVGLALPVVGIGILSQLVNPLVAHIVFAVVVGVLAVGAIVVGIRYRPENA
jgi:MFS family permease